tara:strand:- start:110 stop:661 length:552 start_codon:yes stop_codon:yes gene_type:complete
MFNLFKKSEYETISQKIKYKNHKITEILNKAEFNKLSKLSKKKQKDYLREMIDNLSGSNFAEVFAYSFDFKEIPMFSYNLHISENSYQLVIYGKDEFNGFRCDYLSNENVYLLTLKTNDEVKEDEDDFKRLIGNDTFDITNKITKTSFEVTKKAKKLHDRMIGTEYLNEFSYNERKKNPIRVI